MSGIIAWLTGFLDGNTGKYTYRPTTFRAYTWQTGALAGLGEGGGYVGDGVDFALTDDRPHFMIRDDRPHFTLGE